MKQRVVTNNNDAVLNTESIEVNVERKFLRSHRWLRFVTCHLNRINKKLLLVECLLLFLFIIVFTLLYFCEGAVPSFVWTYVADYVLPIGNATDKDYYITRPNGRDDGGVVRVIFMVVSTHIDQTLCYAVASAYFTNIPIVVVGYKKENYINIKKPEIWLHAVEQASLQDSDVVVALDSDIMFTGLDFLPFVDKFIKLSPANLNELDAKAIRTGKMIAPSLYGSERGCYAPQTLRTWGEECPKAFIQIEMEQEKYANSVLEFAEKPFVNYDLNKLQHLNSGTSIHRVWAMRKLFAAFHKFMADNKPLFDENWWEDQSVLAKIYLEVRLWEIEQDYFRKHTDELRTMSNQYGLHAGLIGLDFRNELSGIIHPEFTSDEYELVTEHWQISKTEEIESINVFDKNKDEFVRNLYNKTGVKKLFTERKLTRSYSNVHSVIITPPLLSIVPRHINGTDKPAERFFPLILHFGGWLKYERENAALNYMQWSLPMMFDEEEWKRGKQYAMSMPIELWTSNDEKLRMRYGDVCEKHPLNVSIHREEFNETLTF